jgi:8-oxo-dGTP pyrophosphatase MutT (NUDIX family)
MTIEKASGVVIFYRENKEIYYLILDYGYDYWGFSKGHMEDGEKSKGTAIREAEEETGIKDLNFINDFEEKSEYSYELDGKKIYRENNKDFSNLDDKDIFKIVSYFLAETKTKKITISSEHKAYKWLTYQDALEKLTYKDCKETLEKANRFLKTIS